MARAIEKEDTLFRAVSFALDQRFGSLNHVSGFIVPQDLWGEGLGRAYRSQSDMEIRFASFEQLRTLRELFVGRPLSELIRGNGSGAASMEAAIQHAFKRLTYVTPSLRRGASRVAKIGLVNNAC